MVDFLEIAHQIVSDGASWSTAIAIILAILKIIDGRHKRKVNVQQSKDIRDIKDALGIWENTRHTVESPKRSIVKSFAILLKSLLVKIKRRKSNMSSINKGILIPIISAIALIIKQYSGYELTNEEINAYADIILFAISMAGIFITPRKETKKDEQLDFTDGPAA